MKDEKQWDEYYRAAEGQNVNGGVKTGSSVP